MKFKYQIDFKRSRLIHLHAVEWQNLQPRAESHAKELQQWLEDRLAEKP